MISSFENLLIKVVFISDNMLDMKTTFINKFSKDEIMNLFDVGQFWKKDLKIHLNYVNI